MSESQAQDLLKSKDLSQFRIDQMTDADVAKFKAQMNDTQQTIAQVEQLAIAKGMSSAEFAKLKQRINMLDSKANPSSRNTNNPQNALSPDRKTEKGNYDDSEKDVEKFYSKPMPLIDPLIFGSELYTSIAPNFEPNSNIATPLNYILGPGDKLSVTMYGVQEYNGELAVSLEGNISVPNVGLIKVAGLTIEAATEKLKTVLGNSVYPYLRSGQSKLSLTLSEIRSIKVLVIGSFKPGTYTLSSLSTIFNALYNAGGPSSFGSFREIELLRNNKIIKKIDLYKFLLHGDLSDDVALRDNDVIRIPPYKTRVELKGQVKRPGIFEVLSGENFTHILNFASGFTDTAYKASVKIYQQDERERKVQDIKAYAYNSYEPSTGDVFLISKILDRFQNRVTISGAVFRPDIYQLQPGMRVADIIRSADGLKEDAFMQRGQIMRIEDDLTRSIVSFDVRKALAGDESNNFILRREDEVVISSVLELRETLGVTIQGEIRKPGQYDFVENLTLKDLILQAGGFTDAAFKNVEIARLIRRDSIVVTDNRASIVIDTDITDELSKSNIANILLQPFDVITIRRKAGYILPESVTISGQVQKPGPYALTSMTDRVSDVLRRAGGFTPDANPDGAYLKRYKTEAEKKKIVSLARIALKNSKDTVNATFLNEDITREYDQIPLDLTAILQDPNIIENITLRSRDEIFVPKFDEQVRISGEVLLATQIPYNKNNHLLDYISQAGGFSGNAWRKKVYVVNANGKATVVKQFLFFKSYPKISPGSEIIVPREPEKRPTTTGEIIGIASALASLAGVVIAILRL